MSTAVVVFYLALIVAWAFVATTWAWTSADSDSQSNSKHSNSHRRLRTSDADAQVGSERCVGTNSTPLRDNSMNDVDQSPGRRVDR